MKRPWSTGLGIAVLCLASSAAFAFEGSITYKIERAKGTPPRTMVYQVKGDRLRLNIEDERETNAMLILPSEQTMVVLMPARKAAMKEPLKPETFSPKKTGGPEHPVTFTKTGRTYTVAGHKCAVYTYKSDVSEGEVCSASDLGKFYFGQNARSSEMPSWAREAREKNMFPLRVNHKELKNGDTFSMVATEIQSASLPESLFTIPSDYKVMQGFGGPGAAGAKGSAAPGAPGSREFMEKMMHASPADRQKMLEQLRNSYGQGNQK